MNPKLIFPQYKLYYPKAASYTLNDHYIQYCLDKICVISGPSTEYKMTFFHTFQANLCLFSLN